MTSAPAIAEIAVVIISVAFGIVSIGYSMFTKSSKVKPEEK